MTDASRARTRDRGAIDVSVEMLFGALALILFLLVVFDAVAYWHTRNIFDEAAAEGARVAAAFDGTCDDGIAAATAMVEQIAGGWSSRIAVDCTDGPVVSVTVGGRPPGILAGPLGTWVAAPETAPKEG